MKAYLINMHLLVPRSRSCAKVKVKYTQFQKKSVHFLMLNISKISRRFFCKFGMVSPNIQSSIQYKTYPVLGRNFRYIWLICTCSPRQRYMSQEMCIDVILIPTTLGKTHLISQCLSLSMPRLNQNQRIQALTMLACGDNVSNVSRAFGCHRNKIIQLCQCFQQTGGVADCCRPRVTNP